MALAGSLSWHFNGAKLFVALAYTHTVFMCMRVRASSAKQLDSTCQAPIGRPSSVWMKKWRRNDTLSGHICAENMDKGGG